MSAIVACIHAVRQTTAACQRSAAAAAAAAAVAPFSGTPLSVMAGGNVATLRTAAAHWPTRAAGSAPLQQVPRGMRQLSGSAASAGGSERSDGRGDDADGREDFRMHVRDFARKVREARTGDTMWDIPGLP
eukprot:353536-Chlamydomonas_euryale.AAC.7